MSQEQELFNRMAQSVIEGEPEHAAAYARQAIAENVDPLDAINQGYTVGINYVGKMFGSGECYLPDLIRGGEAIKAALSVLQPELVKSGKQREIRGRVVIGTVQGDIHEIGKSLVATMLAANGYEVYDLGVNVKPESFMEKLREVDATLLCLSALLTTTMMGQRHVIQALNEAGIRDRAKVMVGGAPVTQAWADEIGADGYAENAAGAVVVANKLLGPKEGVAG
jgi:corrinoid protein of di/trimethylamine methyltransferase